MLRAIPPGAQRALDVGCGQGLFTRELAARVPTVVGIDLHGPSIELARRGPGEEGIEFLLGDFGNHPFEPGSFDVVASVASLHHMEMGAALGRMVALLRPGGLLAVIGLAREGHRPTCRGTWPATSSTGSSS